MPATPPSDESIDISALVDELQQRVAMRRADGSYPPGLEEQLEAEFAHVMNVLHRTRADLSPLRSRVAHVRQAADAVRVRDVNGSRVPGGGTVHAVAGRVVGRQTRPLADATRSLGEILAATLEEIVDQLDALRNGDDRRIDAVLSSVVDRLAVIDHLTAAVLDLERRLADLETGTTQRL